MDLLFGQHLGHVHGLIYRNIKSTKRKKKNEKVSSNPVFYNFLLLLQITNGDRLSYSTWCHNADVPEKAE